MSTALISKTKCSKAAHAFADGIVARVREELRRSSYAAVRTFTCECHCGVLRITGQSPSFYLKQKAVSLVVRCLQSNGAEIFGIDVNGISVKGPCNATL